MIYCLGEYELIKVAFTGSRTIHALEFMANKVTTYQQEQDKAWYHLWQTLKEMYPEPLKELNALVPSYRALPARASLVADALWGDLQDSEDPYPALELARAVLGWQQRHHLVGYAPFTQALKLLDVWAMLKDWQSMPIYDSGSLWPIVPNSDLPSPPKYEPWRFTKEEYQKLILEYMGRVEEICKNYNEYGPDLVYKEPTNKPRLKQHVEWISLYLLANKSHKDIADCAQSENPLTEAAIGKAIRETSIILGIELPQRAGRKHNF